MTLSQNLFKEYSYKVVFAIQVATVIGLLFLVSKIVNRFGQIWIAVCAFLILLLGYIAIDKINDKLFSWSVPNLNMEDLKLSRLINSSFNLVVSILIMALAKFEKFMVITVLIVFVILEVSKWREYNKIAKKEPSPLSDMIDESEIVTEPKK